MQLYIARDNQQTGPFTLEEVRAALADGRVTPSDMAWHDGLAGWTPLGDIPGVSVAQPPPIPQPPPSALPLPSSSESDEKAGAADSTGHFAGYDLMATTAKEAIENLLLPIRAASVSLKEGKDVKTDEFLVKFLVYADKFTAQCCLGFANGLRQHSIVPEVRGTPTKTLAGQIRSHVFDSLDAILKSYVEELARINIDLRRVASEFQDMSPLTSIAASAAVGYGVGGMIGGFGEKGGMARTVGTVVGAMAAAKAAEQKALLLALQQQSLLQEARQHAFSRVVDYLKAAADLPAVLLDYGCAHCYGGKVDFQQQQRALSSIESGIKQDIEAGIAIVRKLPLEEQRREDERQQREAKREAEQERCNLEEEKEKKRLEWHASATAVCIIGMIVIACGAIVESGPNPVAIFAGIIVCIVGIFIWCSTGFKTGQKVRPNLPPN